MLRRTLSFALPFAVVFALGVLSPTAVALGKRAQSDQDKKAPSCQETTKRVLEPYLKALAAAQAAHEVYEELNGKLIQAIQDAIALRRGFKKRFAEARAKDEKYYDDRIRYAQQAIQDAMRWAGEEIAKLGKRASEEQAKGNERAAQATRARIAKLRKDLAAGDVSQHSKELGFGNRIKGWRKYIADMTKKRAERMTEWGAGKIAIHHKELGYSLSQEGTNKEIAKKEGELADAQARKPGHHLRPIGYSLRGKGIDELLAKRKAELADAQARIGAGTFKLHIRTLGYTADRNHVQKLIHEAKDRYRDTFRAWGEKSYRTHNTMLGYTLSNGDIEKMLEERRKKLSDYQALGMNAIAWASGRGQRGTDIMKAIDQAQRDRNAKAQAYHRKVLAEWRTNRAKNIEKMQKDIARYEKILNRHKELWREDLEKQKEHLEGRLKRALAETPCGGAGGATDPNSEIVDRHHSKIDKMAETDEEKQRRRDLYGDRIYREDDGTVHGDPKDAWRNALRDLNVGDGQMSLPEWITWIKDKLDWLQGFTDANEIREFNARIDEFIRQMEALDPSKMSKKEFFKQRKALRGTLKGIEEALEGGLLSPKRLQGYIDAVVKGGSESKTTREQLKNLRMLLRRSEDAKRMWKSWGAIKSVASGLAGDALAKYNAFVKGSADTLAKRTDAWWAGKSKLDKGLFIFSVAAAAANAYQQTQKGVATSEAIGRASVDFVIDLVIGGVPILAAAEMGTQILFTSYAMATGDKGVSDATLSNTAKWAAGKALDQVAAGGAALGRWSIALERMASGDPSVEQILGQISWERLRQSLSRVEERISMLPPKHPDEARLMRARQAFRKLMRAKRGLEH
jgi:hypothetical protein